MSKAFGLGHLHSALTALASYETLNFSLHFGHRTLLVILRVSAIAGEAGNTVLPCSRSRGSVVGGAVGGAAGLEEAAGGAAGAGSDAAAAADA